MCTSEAFACTAFRKMSFNMLIICSTGILPVSVTHVSSSSNTGKMPVLHRAFRHSQDFIDGREALHNLCKPVISKRYQTSLATELSQLIHVRISRHQIAQAVVHHQHLVDAQAPAVAGLSAAVAPFAAENSLGRET